MELLQEIALQLQQGKAKEVPPLVQKALDAGVPVDTILHDGLMAGMDVIAEKFKNNEIYIPQVLIAAKAMHAGMELLRPLLVASGARAAGKVVLGTVKGDLHDIGKNLVKMMMESKGLDVVDLGTNVTSEDFVARARAENAQVIACSALLTTTMVEMKRIVDAAKAAGIRHQVKIMVGGAPVTGDFCQSIEADIYSPDAASAAQAAVHACKNRPTL